MVLGLDIAARKGLRLPLVYNTNGWERADVLRLLDGIAEVVIRLVKVGMKLAPMSFLTSRFKQLN